MGSGQNTNLGQASPNCAPNCRGFQQMLSLSTCRRPVGQEALKRGWHQRKPSEVARAETTAAQYRSDLGQARDDEHEADASVGSLGNGQAPAQRRARERGARGELGPGLKAELKRTCNWAGQSVPIERPADGQSTGQRRAIPRRIRTENHQPASCPPGQAVIRLDQCSASQQAQSDAAPRPSDASA